MGVSRYLHTLRQAWREWRTSPRFGFVRGHDYLTDHDLAQLEAGIGREDAQTVERFERGFARLVGDGDAVSFAAGRMGFYAALKLFGLREGDEVVLQGATCSVMANAILRIGARPVYADIDPETLGSSATAILRVLTSHTRVIVAQHSFGIPCDIEPIAELARERGVLLVEDCALTLGSSIHGVVCGNFGDAAIFSTDHSKPLNTMTGGLVYTRDRELYTGLKKIQHESGEFSMEKQQALWDQLLFERKYCRPDRYGRMRLTAALRARLSHGAHPFADEDFGTAFSDSYAYPARMPAFLAAIGERELERWPATVRHRKALLGQLSRFVEEEGGVRLPVAYHDSARDIVPLRLAWADEEAKQIRESLKEVLDLSWTWFMQPVVATTEPLERFGYQSGMCPVSERVGPNMINLPCNVGEAWGEALVASLKAHVAGDA